jgi:hypothetical protein
MNMTQLEIEKIVALAFAAYRLNNNASTPQTTTLMKKQHN